MEIKEIVDAITGETIQREFNVEELAQHEKDLERALKNAAENEKVAIEKAALLAKLGITEDEAKLLLS